MIRFIIIVCIMVNELFCPLKVYSQTVNIKKNHSSTTSKKEDSVFTEKTIILRNLKLVSFPEKIISYENLETLDISGNCFFPDDIGNFKNLQSLKAEFIFQETCGDVKDQKIDIDQIFKLEKLKELTITGINCGYIYEKSFYMSHLKKIDVWSEQCPVSIIQSQIKEVGYFSGGLLSLPENENLSTIYSGRYYKTNIPVKKKIKIPQTGIFTNYYSNNQKIVEGNFIDNKPDGKWIFWFQNGRIAQVRYYNKGQEDKQWVILNETGDSLLIETFIDGKLDMYERRYPKNDPMYGELKIIHYSDTINRISNRSYWQGDKKITFFNSKTDSWKKETSYYLNRQKSIEVTYRGNDLYGPLTQWFENGQLKEEKYYKQGKLDGEQRYWNSSGITYQIDIYKDGKLIKSTIPNDKH